MSPYRGTNPISFSALVEAAIRAGSPLGIGRAPYLTKSSRQASRASLVDGIAKSTTLPGRDVRRSFVVAIKEHDERARNVADVHEFPFLRTGSAGNFAALQQSGNDLWDQARTMLMRSI